MASVAGTFLPPAPIPALTVNIGQPSAVTVDSTGNVYFTSPQLAMVLRLDNTGQVTSVASSVFKVPPAIGFLFAPTGVALDAIGNIYVADSGSVYEFSTNGGSFRLATGFGQLHGLATDKNGNVYAADSSNCTIWRINSAGQFTDFAGNGTCGYFGDGSSSVYWMFDGPLGLAIDGAGNVFIADSNNQCIREVMAKGTLSTVTGLTGKPSAVAVDAQGTLYITLLNGSVAVKPQGQSVSYIAGQNGAGFGGDGGPASNAQLNSPYGIAVDSSGNLFIADFGNLRIREISNGKIQTVAGGGPGTFSGVAPLSVLTQPGGVARDSGGNLYFADITANRVYEFSPTTGAIASIAGTGIPGFSGDNGPATAAGLNGPTGVAVDHLGNLYIADTQNQRIRKITPSGRIVTVAGPAGLNLPQSVATDSSANLYIADTFDNRVLKLSTGGILSVVAGTGTGGYNGDNIAATTAELYEPAAVSVDGPGNLYIADQYNARIRKVNLNGTISTVAGGGSQGDGGPATAAQLILPTDVAVDSNGNIFIADDGSKGILEVTSDGNINGVAGGYSIPYGDGSPATDVGLWGPCHLAIGASGDVYVSDSTNPAIRLMRPVTAPMLTITAHHTFDFPRGWTGQVQVTVSNPSQVPSTPGNVSVNLMLSGGLSLADASGSGWTCGGSTCSRSDSLNAGVQYSPIVVNLNVPNSAPSLVLVQATVNYGGTVLGAQDVANVYSPAATVIQTNPEGLTLSLDGTSFTTPQTYYLPYGEHTISASFILNGTPGTEYIFGGWNDGGAQTHTITVGAAPQTLTASYAALYLLSLSVYPPSAGTITIGGAPVSGTLTNSPGTTVTVTAAANSPYSFISWGGIPSGTGNPATITMNGPVNLTADFGPPGFTCSLSGKAVVSVGDVRGMIDQALGIAPASNDFNQDGSVTVSDLQTVLNAAVNLGCLY
jgi:trimeric autotransporter adhesin